ncbi:MAG: class I poly(R)-hydroxyalkanoic acid synthase [Alphaproteobacteria bacterium]|nr:class I poly(R)-hydroxyalkanoic acid synthase [Alphaproteobacteria bacterium]
MKTASPTPPDDIKIPDPMALSQALMKAYDEAAPLFKEALDRFIDDLEHKPLDPFNLREAYMEFLQKVSEDPAHYAKLQMDFWQKWMHLWQESALQFLGEPSETVIKPDPKDRRFRDPEWDQNALFNFIKQSYLLTCQWMHKTIDETRGLSKEDRQKLEFSAELLGSALSPTNFILTNPEVLKETVASGGENLVRGFENLIEDMRRGKGELAIKTTDYKAFKVGENLATTKGAVVYRNDLMELLQYAPGTDKVFKRPLLIIPPWINKYYILDLKAENSFIKWAVDQGHTVFCVSWVNPDKKLAQKRFEDYMEEGVLSALDQIQKITGEKDANVIGYCLGGTLLTITMAYLAAQKKSSKIASATFFTTLIDFENAGEMKLFMDDTQLELLDLEMAEKGVLQGKQLQKSFSLLRSNDLIWSFVVNNYLMGKEPFPFDLLYWNDDSTNMPAAMHSFYLRKLYRDNLLVKPGGIKMNKTPIDISKIKTPAYFLSTREDHIAPWKATYAGPQHFGGPVTFTLAASGHTAGVVNHPAKKKYCYWSYNKIPAKPHEWTDSAKEHEGSWWPHWEKWIAQYTGEKIPARTIKNPLDKAPGKYVRLKS